MATETTLPNTCIGRLAPSPTGAQHVGNARTYLLAWLSARVQRGKLLLRIEDIDSPRVKPWAIEQTLEDLAWLGLDWDAIEPRLPRTTATPCLPDGIWLQTDRVSIYEQFLEKLRLAERLYPCYCSRKDIEAAASAPHPEDHMIRYPDTCRHRHTPDELFPHRLGHNTHTPEIRSTQSESTKPFAWRFRSQNSELIFTDLIVGRQTANPHQSLGDFVIAKSTGHIAYQLAVVIDDHEMGVTEVIRGDDLIPSTFWQLEIYKSLGWTAPRFAHVPLVVGPDGRRLAKRHGDTRLSEIRKHGQSSEKLLGFLAYSCGLVASPTPTTARELLESLQQRMGNDRESSIAALLWNNLPRNPYVFDAATWHSLIS
ncbi:MAG: tRNA glutamyl-Q(34) synthetase GluQRS [Planctomycetaceae bacterium]|nr:tRNA glutamyl-Q(34) synthetase GluQRS [Planctomycetaceae bacterium]